MSYSPQAFNTATSTSLGEVKIGSGFTLAGDGTLNNGGVTQLTGAATIKVSGATGSITLTDVGVTAVNAGTGITTNVTTGSVTVTNAGVTAFNGSTGAVLGVGAVNGSTGSVLVVNSITAGTAINVSATTGSVTVNNLGVQSIAGTSNQITASASTGAVTLSLPQSIATTSGVTFSAITATNYYVSSGSLTFSGNISAPAWTTSGIRHISIPATLTDTSSAGTVANAYTNVFGGNTIAASSAVTYTNYGAIYVNTPVAGTNVTITNPWSIILAGGLLVNGLLSVNNSLETYTSPAISANAVTLNFNNGNTFALASNAANITANYTNVPTTTGQIIATALIITQGATAYIPSAITINTVSQTLKWQGGSPPTGNANKTDIVSFTFICNGTTTPTVLGSLSTYG
jgi:hypothetical protein